MVPAIVAAGALGYLAADLWIDGVSASVPGDIPAVVTAALVAAQAVLLVFRFRMPVPVFAGTVLLDAVILATSAGELGVGSAGVIFAAYALVRHVRRDVALIALGAGGAITTVTGSLAALIGSTETPFLLILSVVVRLGLQYAAPAAVAEYALSRERLVQALREQARMAEQERLERAERTVRAEREALARELHDIAGHHLSGIIVSAQAAAALTRTGDLDRVREMLRAVQDDARIALADLRRTVGLLRSDDDASGTPSPVPTIGGIETLVDIARERGQDIAFTTLGAPCPLGALAEATAYRMVQESLSNAARHAPGASCEVTIRSDEDAVEITVSNTAPPAGTPRGASRSGYGLAGMAERSELIGAQLTAGASADGGWTNRLRIPFDPRSTA